MLALHSHPLASYCHKVLIALYEHGIAFDAVFVDLGDAASRAAHFALTPLGKMPVLVDRERGETVTESTVIIEYLDLHYAKTKLIPANPDAAWKVRERDRLFDLYVNDQMSKIVTNNLRPDGQRDPFGVAAAKDVLAKVYAMIDPQLAKSTWACGETFTMADCAAAPALWYADKVLPFGAHKNITAYLGRLMERPSFARVLEEAKPYLSNFPGGS